MIFGKGKNFKLQYSLATVWTDFHTATIPITKNYSKCKSITQNEIPIIKNGSSINEPIVFGNTETKFQIDFYVKHYDEDVEGGTIDGTTVRGITYFHNTVVANSDLNYIRLYPDLDNAPSKYYEVVIARLSKFDFNQTTWALYRLELVLRAETSSLT